MRKCRNCYHSEVCKAHEFTIKKCAFFKERNSVIELPCRDDIEFLIVRHGRWNPMESVLWNGWECSVCGKKMYVNYKCDLERRYPYCPNCGAKMINSN